MQEVGLKEKPYKIVKATGTVFPSHIHNVYEVLRVTRGSSHAVIDEKEYHLSEGECLAVFPLQYHSYSVDKSSRIEIYVFSPHFIAEFEEFAVGKTPHEPRFDGDLLPKSPTEIGNILAVKSFFYTLCHELATRVSFDERTFESANPSLLDRLFLFVDKHYDGKCTLSAASEALAYDYTYLSKLFKSKTGMPYGEYMSAVFGWEGRLMSWSEATKAYRRSPTRLALTPFAPSTTNLNAFWAQPRGNTEKRS